MSRPTKELSFHYHGKLLKFRSRAACSREFGISQGHLLSLQEKPGKLETHLDLYLDIKAHGKPCAHEGCTGRTPPGQYRVVYCEIHITQKWRDKRQQVCKNNRIAEMERLGIVIPSKDKSVPKTSGRLSQFDRYEECKTCAYYLGCLEKHVFQDSPWPTDRSKCYSPCGSSLQTNLSSGGNVMHLDNRHGSQI